MSLVRIAVLSSLIVGGCVGEAEEELGSTAQEAKAQPGTDEECPPWACGSNSPEIDFHMFHELNELHLFNDEGFQIQDFRKKVGVTWVSYRPDVQAGALTARSLNPPGDIVWYGAGVEQMQFVIYNNLTHITYYMTVKHVGRAPLWAHPGGNSYVTPTYQFTWSTSSAVGNTGVNLCGASNDADGVADFHAVLFEDDRIDADAIRVTRETPNWFNIGCAGHLLAKQHLTGNSRGAATIMGLAAPSLNQRTAMAKAFSGDYCGGGNPMTVAGVPLRVKDSLARTNTVAPGMNNIEARFNELGAICLNVPRIDYTGLGSAIFPGGVEPLLLPAAGWCTGTNGTLVRPPPCSGTTSSFQGAYVITVHP